MLESGPQERVFIFEEEEYKILSGKLYCLECEHVNIEKQKCNVFNKRFEKASIKRGCQRIYECRLAELEFEKMKLLFEN